MASIYKPMLDLKALRIISQSKDKSKICFYAGATHCEYLTTNLEKLGYRVTYDSKLHDRRGREYEDFRDLTQAYPSTPLIRSNSAPLPLHEFKWLSK